MFKIGEFSKLTQVSTRMLRYYDEMGLLKPAKIDSLTGYRMYSAEQISTLNRIIYLRDSGFNVAEIALSLDYSNNDIIEQLDKKSVEIIRNQRIIAENAQFTGIAAGQGVGFTTGLLHLRKGLGMRETPIRPHSWHCRMQSDYQYDGNRKRPPVWRRHRGSLRPRGRNLGRVEGMTGSCGSGCDPAIHARRLRVYHRPRRLRMASRISIFFAARRFEPLNSMG